jgi:hypothetical protein
MQAAMTPGKLAPSHVLTTWKPLAELPAGNEKRRAVEDFLSAATNEERRVALERGNTLFRLHNIYKELGILRENPGEKARDFAALIATPNGELHAALRGGGGSAPLLALLQEVFEFGKGAVHPKYEAVRSCLLELWRLEPRGPSMKYSLYPNGIIYSGGGKTHEEMAREFVAQGYGAGVPQAGGQIFRTGALDFVFDLSSTAFRASGTRPVDIASAFHRWLRVTGADESKVRFIYHPPAGGR